MKGGFHKPSLSRIQIIPEEMKGFDIRPVVI